jgi:predicted acylesterase/phospholipase RssA
VYNADNLEDFIRTEFDQFGSIKRKVAVSSVDVETGTYVVHDENTPWDQFPTAVRASAAIPGVF